MLLDLDRHQEAPHFHQSSRFRTLNLSSQFNFAHFDLIADRRGYDITKLKNQERQVYIYTIRSGSCYIQSYFQDFFLFLFVKVVSKFPACFYWSRQNLKKSEINIFCKIHYALGLFSSNCFINKYVVMAEKPLSRLSIIIYKGKLTSFQPTLQILGCPLL